MPRQLKDVVVKGVALVKRPANKRPIHLFKNQGGSVPNSTTDNATAPSASAGVLESAAPANVVDAIQSIKLAKGESEQASAALEGIATLLHNNPHLTLQDLMAAGEASGLGAIEKAKKPVDEDEAEEEEEDEEEDEDEGEDPTDNLPPAIRAKAKAREAAKKSAGASQAKGAAMPATVEKAEHITISKAEYETRMARLEKAEKEWRRHEALSIHKAIKEENQSNLAALACDHDKLATIVKALKDRDPAQANELVTMLKGFNAQVSAAERSGSSPYKAQAQRSGAAPSTGYGRFTELVKAEQARSGCSQAEATLRIAKSAEANEAYVQHKSEVN